MGIFSLREEPNSRVLAWLMKKDLTVSSTVSVSSPTAGFPVSDWSSVRICPRFLRLIGPSREHTRAPCV
eukprot:1176069-Prorocentrum_minimum.AAC.3